MQETIYFEHADVKVTEARFIANGETFAMKNITSVKTTSEAPSRGLPIIGILVGVGLLFNAASRVIATGKETKFDEVATTLLLGLAFTILCTRWFRSLKPMLHIVLKTAGNEQTALRTQQPEYLKQVVDALNKAIAHK